MHSLDTPLSLAQAIDETLVSFLVDLVVESRVRVETRCDGENHGEEKGGLLTDPRSRVSSRIKEGKMDIGEIEKAEEGGEKASVPAACLTKIERKGRT